MALRQRHLVWVDMGPEWKAVERALVRSELDTPKELGNALNQATKPIIAKVRRAAFAIPAYGAKHTGLRGRLAAGVKANVIGQNATIVAEAAPGEEGLPRGFDNGPKGFRHPVYGNREVWVQQRGFSWFREPIAEEGDAVERQLTNVLEEMAQNIAVAGAR